MGVFESLSGVYIKAEEAWYGLVDSLSEKGIPLYAYTDFLDKRGIPSFPFTIALIVLFLVLAFFLFSGNSVDANIKFRFSDEEGNAVNDVSVSLEFESGGAIGTKTMSSNSVWPVKNLPFNSKISVSAKKEGFESPKEQTILVDGKKEHSVSFVFKKPRSLITGLLQVKSTTGTIIKNANCTALTDDKRPIKGLQVEDKMSFSNVPEGIPVAITCEAAGYETREQQVTFKKDVIQFFSMAPKAGLEGKERVQVLFRLLDKESKEPVGTAKIRIFKEGDDKPLFDDETDAGGEYLAEILGGTIIRAAVEAKGYISKMTDPVTVVKEMPPMEIFMELGGKTVSVTVVSRTGLPVNDVIVSLYDEYGALLESKKTTAGPYGGNAVFTNLDPNKTYYITAYKQGFLPKRVKFSPGAQPDLKIELENSSPGNSARLTLTVLDSEGLPAKKAKIRFYTMEDGKKVPLGIPQMETDMQGKVSVIVPEGKIIVEAETDTEIQSKEFDIKAGNDITETIAMERKANLVELKFLDDEGKPIQGEVTIRSKSGEILFKGRPSKDGSVVFDAKGNETFDVEVETDKGKKFTEEVRIGGEKKATVTITTTEAKLAPSIEFAGVFDAKGQKVDGISRGEFYWLKFVVSWQSNEQAGIHVRIGDDSKSFAESMEYGIYGFDAVAKKFFYGKSYQPPLGTREDKLNSGTAGEKNKYLEMYFDQPADQQAIKVKVKANEIGTATKMPVHFRAWVKAGSQYYRDPEDSELGKALSTNSKASLYAAAKTEEVKIFSTKPKCSEGLCLELSFFDDEGSEKKTQDFSAVIGRRYALEARVSADAVKTATVNAETAEQEKIRFADFLEGSSSFWPESGYDKKSVSISGLRVSDSATAKTRAYFEAKAQGSAYIKVTAVEGEKTIEKKIYFRITGIREMELVLANNGSIKPGEKLSAKLNEKETGQAITDAQFTVYSGERPALSLKGTGIEGSGLEGKYLLGTEALGPGAYRLVASRRDYQDKEAQFTVSLANILTIEGEPEFFLDKAKPQGTQSITIKNNVGTAKIESLQSEFYPQKGWTENFSLDVVLPSGGIRGGGSIYPTLKAAYSGADPNASVHAEGELVIHGTLDSGLAVEAKTQVKANYNKPVPSECLEITPATSEASILGTANSATTINLTVKYKASDKCKDALVLKTRAEAKRRPDPHLQITAPEIKISPGEQKEIAVTITNTIERQTDPGQAADYSLIVESEKVAKSASLKVYFINPLFSLQTNDNIPIFATVDEDGKVRGLAPLYIRNVGRKKIENIKALESGRFPKSTAFNVLVKTASIGTGPSAEASATLDSGEQITPPWVIEVTDKTKDYPESEYPIYLDISGNIDGKKYDSMRTVTVLVKVSISQCLKMTPVMELAFRSTDSLQGVISQKVKLQNNCGEGLRNIEIAPAKFGENELSLYRANALNSLGIGEEAEFQLRLAKRSDYFNRSNPDNIAAKGFLENSQKFIESNPLSITIELGQVPETAAGPSFDEVQIEVCETEGKEIKAVRFPQTAQEAECERAYCDAVQFSAFLAKRLAEAAKSAQEKMQSKSFNAEAFGCPKTFCSFNTLGLSTPIYTVFLRNDYVSAEAIKNSLSEEAPSLSNYAVAFRSEEFENILLKATSFSPFNIYMNKPLQGCGRYEFEIQGAVQNASNALQKENMILYVKVTKDRKVTPECTNKIQNMMNFLPVDSGLSNSRTLATWLGMVQTDSKLQKAGEDFAATLFGSRQGRVVRNTSSNKLHILLKELGKGWIMKLSIGQVSETDAKPNTVTLELSSLFDEPDELVRNEIATKAKEGLRAMAEGAFSLDACIGENEDYLMISRFEKLGELSIDGPKEMALYYGMKNCIKLKVQGTINGEEAALKTNFSEISPKERAGIKSAWIEIEKSGARERITEYSDTEAGTPIALAPVEGKEGLNEKEFFLCAEGDNGNVFQAIGKTLKVKAKSVSIPEARDAQGEIRVREMMKWHEVKISTCGMHPYDMLRKISDQSAEVKKTGKKIEAYTVLVWKGDPEELTLKSMIAAWRAHKLEQQAGGEDEEGSTMEQKIQSAKKQSIWAYFAACTGATLACNIATGLIFGLAKSPSDIIFNCGIPLIAGFFGPQISGALGGFWQGFKNFFHIGQVHEFVGTGDSGAAVEAVEEDILTGAIFGVSFRGATKFIPSSARGTFATATAASSSIDMTAKSIADDAATRWADRFLTGATAEKSLRENLRSDMQTRLSQRLKKAAGEMKGSFKIEQLNLDNAASSSWSDASESLIQRISANPSDVAGSALGTRVQKAVSAATDDLIDSATVAKKATSSLTTPAGTGGLYQNPASMTDELATKAMSELDTVVGSNAALRQKIASEVREQISRELQGKTTASLDDLTNAVNRAVTKVKGNNADEIFTVAKSNIDDQVRGMFKNPPAASTEVPRGGRIRNFLAKLRDPQFLKNIGRGIFCGALSNIAGLSARQAFLNWRLGELRAEAEEGSGFDFTGPLSNYEGSEVFRKFRPYKITIERDEDKLVRVAIEDLTVETDGKTIDEKLKEMGDATAKDKENYWQEDCEGQLKQGIDELIGCLMPDLEVEGVTKKQVLAYYGNNADIAAACFSEDPANRLDEALLMAVLFTKPENIAGCCTEDGKCIRSNWYEASTGEGQKTIGCAAGELRKAMSEGSPEATVKKLAVANLGEGDALEEYVEEVLATYKTWQKFNYCD